MKESSLGSSAPRLCECSTMKPGRNAPWLGWLYVAAPAAFIGYGLFLVSRSVILAVVVGAAVLLLCRFLIGLNAPPSNGDDG
jgi:hypothetical protein